MSDRDADKVVSDRDMPTGMRVNQNKVDIRRAGIIEIIVTSVYVAGTNGKLC